MKIFSLLSKSVFASIFIATVILYANPQTASAVDASQWQAGNIVEDHLFYDNNSMSVQDIQNFLNSKVQNCDTDGTQRNATIPTMTNAQYAQSRGLPAPPYICLKDYKQVPRSDTIIDNYSGSVPSGAISSAEIIKRAADAYGVSPKTLLVLLQKESPGPLPIDNWPFQSQYKNAMGYACPDTAPCDPSFAGFYNQVTNAAKRIKSYKDFPSSYRHQPGKTTAVYYNPNFGCGTSPVVIQNYATAGLYNYTPYQPNKAALDNLYGTGDSCSAYGNRNFWRIYNDWFSGSAYDWQIVDQAVFLDPARTRRIDYYPSVQPGTITYARVQAKNIGTTTWDQMTRLATNNPPGRNSAFYDPNDWLSPNRPATPMEGYVKPGAIGTFDFTLKAPGNLQAYTEAFNLVQDGVKLFPEKGQNFAINVTNEISANRLPSALKGIGIILNSGESIISADGNTALYLQDSGNLVILRDFQIVWQTNTANNPGSKLYLQGDGNVVLYNKDMVPTWSTSTPGSGADHIVLQIDSNLALYGPNGPIWSSATNTPQTRNQIVNNKILSTGLLLPGQRIETPDRTRTLILQGDGNLVLYNKDGRPLWNTQTNGTIPKLLAMQPDGNLVLYDKNWRPTWNSGTAGNGNSRLILQDDTNLVIYKDSGGAAWATYTNR